ncbi:MAG TPA: hypothetical protein VGF84_22490, partial [Micromonosporaceae bacterium]
LCILVTAAAATLLTVPGFPWLVILAVMPAIFVRHSVPDVYLGGVLVVWVLGTDGHPPPTWRVCALALALYYLHTTAALSAVAPIDANITASTFRSWLARLGVVTMITVALSAMVAALQTVAAGDHREVVATYAGLVVLLGVAAYLARVGRRR